MVSSELAPLGFRMLLRGCPGLGYAWAYLLGRAIVDTSLHGSCHIQGAASFTPPDFTLLDLREYVSHL